MRQAVRSRADGKGKIGVGVHVHQARGDHAPGRVDHLLGLIAVQFANTCYTTALHGHVGRVARRSRAIDHLLIPDQNIKHRMFSPLNSNEFQ